jgi:uncharacterized protein (DUF433 family)
MNATVNEHGRISGTRITVYDLVPYLEENWNHREIASLLSLSPEQFQAGLDYVNTHKDEVMAVHREIEERNARGNPPEVLAILKQNQAKLRAILEAKGTPLPPHLRNGVPQD